MESQTDASTPLSAEASDNENLSSPAEVNNRQFITDNLRRSQAHLTSILNSAMDAIITVNEKQIIVLFNHAAEKMFLCTAAEAIGQPLKRFIPERFRATHAEHIRAFGLTGVSTRAMAGARAVSGLRANGEEFPVEASISQVEIEGEKFYTVIMRDITERVRAEEVVRESQEQLAGIISSAMDAIITIDDEQKIILFNHAAERMFVCSSREAVGQPIENFIPARFRKAHKSHVETFGQTNVTKRYMGALGAIFGLRANGEEFPIEASISQLDIGNKKFYTVILRDITERRRAEERFSQVVENAPNGMVLVDRLGNISLVNTQMEKIFGYSRDELLGQSIDILVPERFRKHHSGQRNMFLGNPATRPIGTGRDLYGLHKDGSEFPVEIGLSPLDTKEGVMVLGTIVDISERKHAEEKLRAQSEELREQAQMLDLAPVLAQDLHGRIVFWNTGVEQMYGWTEKEAKGKVVHELLQTEFPKPLEDIKVDLFAHGYWEGELVHSTKDGKRIVVTSLWALHKNEHDEPKAILEINNDITARKFAEEEVHKLNETLEQRVAERTSQLEVANKELEAFSYSVSHDLRAPLRHINGFSQAVLEDYEDKLDEEGKFYLQEICGASRNMAQLIDDMLQLSRVTRSEMKREAVNLTDLVNTLIAQLQVDDPTRKVDVNIEKNLTVEADKRLLQIMLTNLLGNAWKFTSKKDGAEIAFGHEAKDGQTIYFVRDNGAGFDMKYADKMFGVFQRLHGATEFEGTGVGLAIVQRIVHRHGGRVWAEGVVNEGATFYFTLFPGFGNGSK